MSYELKTLREAEQPNLTDVNERLAKMEKAAQHFKEADSLRERLTKLDAITY